MMANRLFRTLAGVMAVAAVAYGWRLRTNTKDGQVSTIHTETAEPIAA